MCCFKLLKNNKTNILFVNQFILVRGRYLILEYFTCSLIFKDAHRLPVPQASTPFPATGCLLSLQHLSVVLLPSSVCLITLQVSTPILLPLRGFPSHWLCLITLSVPSKHSSQLACILLICLSHIYGLLAHENPGRDWGHPTYLPVFSI